KGTSPRVRTVEPSPQYYKDTIGQDFTPEYIEKRIYGKAATNPYVTIRFHIPPLWHDDTAVLYMLGRVMSARTGDMYKTMVEENEHATRISASASNSMYDGSFTVTANIKEVRGSTVVSPSQIENEIWTYMENAKRRLFDGELLQRVKNDVEAQFLRSLRGTGIASSLARMETAYKWQFIEEQYKQRMAVTVDDIMRVAQIYLEKGNSVTGILERQQ
ncbi:M16 family metallopeptidase, partial [candidate division KSB1 bacterium]